jgi:hypothetical protein
MHNKNIYNENWKIPAVWQQFSVRGSISITVWSHTCAALKEHWLQSLPLPCVLHHIVPFCALLTTHDEQSARRNQGCLYINLTYMTFIPWFLVSWHKDQWLNLKDYCIFI